MTALLTLVREVTLEGRPAFVTTLESFTDAGVKWMCERFKFLFIGLAIVETAEATLVISKLESDSFDTLIISQLGEVEKAQVSLPHFLEFLFLRGKKSSNEAFTFFLRCKHGNLWVVRAHWGVDILDVEDWYVDVICEVGSPCEWGGGRNVVSHK